MAIIYRKGGNLYKLWILIHPPLTEYRQTLEKTPVCLFEF